MINTLHKKKINGYYEFYLICIGFQRLFALIGLNICFVISNYDIKVIYIHNILSFSSIVIIFLLIVGMFISPIFLEIIL